MSQIELPSIFNLNMSKRYLNNNNKSPVEIVSEIVAQIYTLFNFITLEAMSFRSSPIESPENSNLTLI